MTNNAKTFFAFLFLIIAVFLSVTASAGPISIADNGNPIDSEVEVNTVSDPGTYLVTATAGQTIVFENSFPPGIVQSAQGGNACQLGTHTMTSEDCVVTLQFTAPSFTGIVNPIIGVCYENSITCAMLEAPLQVVPAASTRPTVIDVVPNYGDATDTVTIQGTRFTAGAVVEFGVEVASSTFVSTTEITATVPTGTPGTTVDVTVTTAGGESETSAADQFTYLTPAQSHLEVHSGGSEINELDLTIGMPLTVQLNNVGTADITNLAWSLPSEVIGTIVPNPASSCATTQSLAFGASCDLTFTATSSTKFSPGVVEITGDDVPSLELLIDPFDTLCAGTDKSKYLCRVFLSDPTDGKLGGISGADTLCNTQASAKGYSSSWQAMLATFNGNILSAKSLAAELGVVSEEGIQYVNPDSPDTGSDPGDTWYTSDAISDGDAAIYGAGFVGSVWTGATSTDNPPLSDDTTCKDWTSDSISDTSTPGDLGFSERDNQWPHRGFSGTPQPCSSEFKFLCVEG